MDLSDLITKRRTPRIFRVTRKLNIPDLISHVTQRAAGKEPLFVEDKDYLVMLGLLKEISQIYSLQMYAFSLMPNHVHLLFGLTEDNLYGAMRDLFSRYVLWFNRKYERKGHLFGGPYRQSVCLDDSYLLAASLYIHLNPVRAQLAEEPQNYRWSSCRLYTRADPPKSFANSQFILTMLSDNLPQARETYRLLLKEGAQINSGEVLEEERSIRDFGKKLFHFFPIKRLALNKIAGRWSDVDLFDDEGLAQKIEEWKSRGAKNKPETLKAKKYFIEQLIARGYCQQNIADRLGVSRKTIYNIRNYSK